MDTEIEKRKKKKEQLRETWSNSAEFLLSMLGYAVGFGNVLRFPYLAMVNGGGAFLIPYFFCMIFCAMPIYFLELFIGQNARKGPIGAWDKFAPLFKGIGYSMVLISWVGVLTFQGAVSWILHYFVSSFSWNLPWTSCNSTWNTENCVLTLNDVMDAKTSTNISLEYDILLESPYNNSNVTDIVNGTSGKPVTAAEEYWQYHVLELTSGIDDLGGLRWQLVLAHIIGWVIIYLCIIKGVRSVGKVVWVTATLPYILLTIFLVRTAFLPGSLAGMKYLVTPDFDKLRRIEVWIAAFIQIFYSLAPGWGCIHTIASYNKFNHNFIREVVLTPIGSCFASFFCGFVVFGISGFLAHKSGVSIQEAISTGPGLAFVAYPEAAAQMPGGAIWSVLFFFMLFTVVLDTQFVTVEVVVTGIRDELKLGPKQQQIVLALTTIFNITVGLVFCSRGGMYVFQLVDWYLCAISVFLFTVLECLILTWVYGYRRIYDQIFMMIGKKPLKYVLVPMWGAIIPILLISAMIWSVLRLERPRYGPYVFPDWAVSLGWFIALSVATPIVIFAAVKILIIVIRSKNVKNDLRESIWPMRGLKPEDRTEMNSYLDPGLLDDHNV